MFQPLGDALAAQGAPASPVGPVYPPLLPEEQRLSEYAARLFQAQRFDRSTFDMAIGVSFGGLLLQEWIAANKVRCRVLGLASTAWSGAGLTRIASTGASLVAAMPPRFCPQVADRSRRRGGPAGSHLPDSAAAACPAACLRCNGPGRRCVLVLWRRTPDKALAGTTWSAPSNGNHHPDAWNGRPPFRFRSHAPLSNARNRDRRRRSSRVCAPCRSSGAASPAGPIKSRFALTRDSSVSSIRR